MTFDEEKNLLYVPGGNAAPDIYDEGRPGPNLYTNSLIALDGATGRLAWYRQFIPHDVHDYDVTHAGPIFRTAIGGSTREVIASAGKDGILRLLDRDSTDILYGVPFTSRVNADAAVPTTPVHVCPGPFGGQEWNGSAYDKKLNLLVVPATDWCTEFKRDTAPPDAEKEHTRGFTSGGELKFDPWSAAHGRLTAFEASTGKEKWRYDAPKPMLAGVTVTAGDLIFTGELTSDLLALDARTGKELLRSDVDGPSAGGVVTYDARGVQNVAIVSGFVGVFNSFAPEIGGAEYYGHDLPPPRKMRVTDCIAAKACCVSGRSRYFKVKVGLQCSGEIRLGRREEHTNEKRIQIEAERLGAGFLSRCIV